MLLYINYPKWVTPEVFGFLNLSEGNPLNLIRWYGLMYIVAIVISFILSRYLIKKDAPPTLKKKHLEDYYFWAVIGLILGARIFFCLFYDIRNTLANPISVFWPFQNGEFTGFAGMSYHGGVIGVVITTIIFCKVKKVDFRDIIDVVTPSIPLGYTFGRLGNFINAELYGRITSSPIGMYFPNADHVPLHHEKTQNVVNKLGWTIDETAQTVKDASGQIMQNGFNLIQAGEKTISGVNLPRHPSQLYEAFFEGIVLFFIMWFLARKFKPFRGFAIVVYLAGYAIFRIAIEFFRQPDSYFADPGSGKFTGFLFGGISMGQVLSFLMIATAAGLGVYFYILKKRDDAMPAYHHPKKSSGHGKSKKKKKKKKR